MIVFQNPGLIDINAAVIMGINAKEGDTPIGFFGTGLKYSIATILRNNCEIEIWRGEEGYRFTTKEIETRGKTFKIVCINNHPLGFTTDLGRNWELWQAYRELYSNAKDEQGSVFKSDDDVSLSGDLTTITVKGFQFETIYDRRGEFILEGTPNYVTEAAEIFLRPNPAVFYRGIRVGHSPLTYRHTYNVQRHIWLTEDRTVAHEWQLKDRLAETVDELVCQGNLSLATTILCEKHTAEREIDYNGILKNEARSEQFLDHVGVLMRTRMIDVNATAVAVYLRLRQPQAETFELLELTPMQVKRFDRAVVFAMKFGFPITDYPIIFVKRIGDNIMGLASKGKIYVAEAAFEKGTKEMVATLIEEFVHLREGHADCTRAMQNYLFDKMITFAEELHGEPL